MGIFWFDILENASEKLQFGYTCIVFYRSHWSHSHSDIHLVLSRTIFEKGWMRALIVSIALMEVRQEVDLAVLLMPKVAFFGAWLFGIARGNDFFEMRIWCFGFGLMRFELATSFGLSYLFACFFFGITISS